MVTWRAALAALPLVTALTSRPAVAAICEGPLGRAEVIECALSRSLQVKQARQGLSVVAGRRIAAGLWLPSNPVVSALVASRAQTGGRPSGTAVNWYLTLAQEIEIAGQRGKRLDVADAEAAVQIRRVAVAEREQTAQAVVAYFNVLALRQALVIASEVTTTANALDAYATGRVKESLLAPLDADLLRAESIRVRLLRSDTERRLAEATTRLATLMGRDPSATLEVTGTLDAPDLPETALQALVDRAQTLRGELAAAEAERQTLDAQRALWKRQRAPNVTLSFVAQNDGFNELVLGGGLSLPIPLPAPVGHTYRGEIAEATARIEQAQITIEVVRRQVKEEVVQAFRNLQTRRAALGFFSDDLVARALADVGALREGLSARQLSVREALLAQRTLLELLLSHLEARASYAHAWVELTRAAGLSFTGATP